MGPGHDAEATGCLVRWKQVEQALSAVVYVANGHALVHVRPQCFRLGLLQCGKIVVPENAKSIEAADHVGRIQEAPEELQNTFADLKHEANHRQARGGVLGNAHADDAKPVAVDEGLRARPSPSRTDP